MSIDQLISSLDKTERDPLKIKEICQEILKDYLGIIEAYAQLLQKFQGYPEKVECLCEIVKYVITNILSINSVLKNIEEMLLHPNDLDRLVGQILKDEQLIEELIENFEA